LAINYASLKEFNNSPGLDPCCSQEEISVLITCAYIISITAAIKNISRGMRNLFVATVSI